MVLPLGFHGIAMNFSPGKARRKWPCGGLACGQRPMVTVAAILLLLGAQAGSAAAARKSDTGLWGDLFGTRRPKLRGPVLPAVVPLPKPRPAEAPSIEPAKPASAPQPTGHVDDRWRPLVI